MTNPLADQRRQIDAIDEKLLKLLGERNGLAAEVLETKIASGLPIFVPEREDEKIAAFRHTAKSQGLDPEWAEDFLRMVMSSSRERQSQADFPQCKGGSRTIVIIGGDGLMGRCYGRAFSASGHQVRVLETENWDRAGELLAGADLALVTVPIRATEEIIGQLGPHLEAKTLLADFTSQKADPLNAMLQAHTGPVLGLHPMHGPDVTNLSKQLIISCPGRDSLASDWLLEQFQLWGLRVQEISPDKHDRIMHQVQGLRHFVALLHGSFLRACNLPPDEILALSSPIYRAELMMTGRIFAQNAELYADIVFANKTRRDLLLDFLEHHKKLIALVKEDDKSGFIEEFLAIGEFFGEFAEQAKTESEYLVHRLADRFV